MANPDDNGLVQPPSIGRTTRAVGLRIAALTGIVISAGAIATATSGDAAVPADSQLDTIVSGSSWPPGSTCCDPE